MIKNLILISLLISFVACNRSKTNILNTRLNSNNLVEQSFKINTNVDTVVLGSSGTKIFIAANSIQSADRVVTLQVKEAITLQQMLLSGLVTKSKDGTLRSGGMLYISTKEKSKIVKPIKIALPASHIDTAMKLYKGEVSSDSSIEWKDPKPVASFDTSFYLAGKNIFERNCRSCDALDRDLTGPALRGITKRVSKKWLFAFTRNNQAVLKSGDKYAHEIYRRWNKTQMNLFPNLTDADLSAVYNYVENSASKDPATFRTDGISKEIDDCRDSCERIRLKEVTLRNDIESLKAEDKSLTEVTYQDDTSNFNRTTPPANSRNFANATAGASDMVIAENNQANYYNFSIEAFGWFNIDQMLKENRDLLNCNVEVSVVKPVNAIVETFLVIPGIKVFVEGGKMSGDSTYGFYSRNGDIPLPLRTEGFIFAVGEVNGKSLFGITRFFTQIKQKIRVEVKDLPKEEIVEAFKTYNLENLKMQVDPVKNKREIDSLTSQMEKLKGIKSEYCICEAKADSQTPPQSNELR